MALFMEYCKGGIWIFSDTGKQEMNEEKRVVIITHQFSIVVKSLEKEITDAGYPVSLLTDDIGAVSETMKSAESYIIYLQDTILDDNNLVKKCILISETIRDNGKNLIFVGSEDIKELFVKTLPSLNENVWLYRPVDKKMLITELEEGASLIRSGRGKKKILIIDDDPLYINIVLDWLKNDYQIEAVTDGMQGVSWLSRHKADLILLDYEMPVVNGPKILEMLKMGPDTASIPVMFLTGIGTRESLQKVMSLKPQGYILKSVTKKDLLKIIGDFFEKQGD